MVSSPTFTSITRAWCGIGRFEMSGEETSLTERLLLRDRWIVSQSSSNHPPIMDLHPYWRWHGNVGQEYDPGLVVSSSHGRNAIPSSGMDFSILDHHPAHVVGDDDCDDDPERRAHDPALCTGDAVCSSHRSTWKRHCTGGAFAGGYLLTWFGFSFFATLLQRELEAAGGISAMWMASKNAGLSAAILILAGIYQLSPWKHRCLTIAAILQNFFLNIGDPEGWGPCAWGWSMEPSAWAVVGC